MFTTSLVLEQFKDLKIDFELKNQSQLTTDFESFGSDMTVFPKDLNQLKLTLEALAQSSLPFHVVSCGHNWGYGDSNLNNKIKVLVNLKFFNQIQNFNEELGTVEISPGVSQKQLADFLISQNSNWVLDVTGADGEASVMGNFLERGFGHTSFGDHESNAKILEVMTTKGKVFCPHLISTENSEVKGLYQHDVSLNLEKIFYQTHFAITTRLLIRLKPKNEKTSFGIIFLQNDLEAEEALKILSDLKSSRAIVSIPHIANSGRVQKTSRRIGPKNDQWIVTVDISGPHELVQARKKILKKLFHSRRKFFFDRTRVYWLQKLSWLFSSDSLVSNQIENLTSLLNLYSGLPQDIFVDKTLGLSQGSFKKMNWLCPLIPVSVGHFINAKKIVADEFLAWGFSYSATLSLVSDRCFVMIAEIILESPDPDRLQQAKECYSSCHSKLLAAGYPFYRYGLRTSEALNSTLKLNPEYLKVYRLLKDHFDPENSLSRGRWGIV